jgi:hypothetical protein
MMKFEKKQLYIAAIITVSSLVAFIIAKYSGCINGTVTDATAIVADTSAFSQNTPLPVPPQDERVIKIVNEQEEKSEFKNKGCCSDKEKRIKENCCCDLVLQEYQTLFSQRKNDGTLKRLSNMKKHDPIFSACYKKMRKVFEKMETDIVTKENEAFAKANPRAEPVLDY